MGKNNTRHGMGKTATKVAAASGLVAIFGAAAAMGAPAAVAESATTTSSPSDVQTTVRKSVTLSGAPDGTLNSSASAMVTQVSSVGNGTATVSVPVGADSARNLDGFSSVPIQGQNAQFTVNPNGQGQEQRIYTKSSDGPIKVKATATLDGKPINPGDVVGKSGVLAVNYTVVNTQTQKQTITYKDAQGNDVSQEVDVAAPIGGTVDIVLPQGFNEITAKGASIGGDGMGGTKMSYSLVLFEPLGNRVANFGYQTRITDGTLPQAQFTFLPIVPLENSTIATTKEAYSGGAQTGATIYGAGTEIGDNLLKLQDGAAKLTTGLEKATAGASKLAKGLNDTAVPGANKLAAGSQTLANGLSGEFNDGMTQLNDGLETLQAGVNALPAKVSAQVQASSDYQLAILGLNALKDNYASAKGAASFLKDGCAAYNTGPYTPTNCGLYFAGLTNGLNLGYLDIANTVGTSLGGPAGSSGLIENILTVIDQVQTTLLGTSTSPGINALVAGGQQLQDGLTGTIIPGANQVADGNATLASGLVTAADGATQIADGLPAAVDGTQQIEQGAGELKTKGADKLAASGETAQADYAYKVAQIEALQAVGLSGSNIPYGPATGPNTQTTGVYQLTLSPASTGASNSLVWGLAALGLLAGGAVGVWAWRRHGA